MIANQRANGKHAFKQENDSFKGKKKRSKAIDLGGGMPVPAAKACELSGFLCSAQLNARHTLKIAISSLHAWIGNPSL